jgi:transcriptional regulator with XRE-family HTH domain
MVIGDRLRQLRDEKKLTQADVEKRTGLVRPYISRVENGHTVPGVDTLEKFARALEVPMYVLFYDGDEPPKAPKRNGALKGVWGAKGKDLRVVAKFQRLFSRIKEGDRRLLLVTARKMAKEKGKQKGKAK